MNKLISISILIIAIALAMGGTARALQPDENVDSMNNSSGEVDSYRVTEDWRQKDALDTDPHSAHEVGDSIPRVLSDEQPLKEVHQGGTDTPHVHLAGIDTCNDELTIDASNPALARQQLDDVLLRFQNETLFIAKFIVCIEITNGPLLISSPIDFSTGANTSEQIVIELRGISTDGLPIKAAPGFSGQHLVKIKSSGPSVALVHWEIDGQGTDTCLEIDSANNAVVVSSVIKNCEVNVRIRNSDNVRLGPETDEEFFRWKNEILDYSQAGILLESGRNNTFAYNIIDNPMIPDDLYHKHAIIIRDRANAPFGKIQTISPPIPVEQVTADGKATVICAKSPDETIRPRVKFNNSPGSIVWYRLASADEVEYTATCDIGSDGICRIDNSIVTGAGCTCRTLKSMKALYSSTNTSAFMATLSCYDQAAAIDTPPVEQPTHLGEGATIPTPAPMAEDVDVDVSSLAAGASGGCGKGGASLVANDIASTHVPTLGLWWIGIAVGIVIGVRSRARSFLASQRRRAEKDRSRS